MAFGMSPFPLQFGSRGAAGDPTALTQYNVDARLTALGLTQAGTGTTWGETGQAATPLYAVAAAKVPLAVETIAGKKYFGPIVNPAGTNLALYSSDATNAAWVKTNCTAALVLGGLEHDADWRGDELFSSLDNLTISGHVTETGSGTTRNYAGLAAADNFSMLAYHTFTVTVGKYYLVKATELTINGNTAAGIYQGGFSNNYSGDPSASGLIVRAIATDLNITLFSYQAEGTPFNVDFSIISVTEVDAHTLLTATANNATALQSITSTSGERVTKWWVQTDDANVFVSHGAPTGSALYEDDFSSDTSSEWLPGNYTVDGTVSVSAGILTQTIGAGDGLYPRRVRPITGLTIGKIYALTTGTVGGTAPEKYFWLSGDSIGDSPLPGGASQPAVAGVKYYVATGTTAYLTTLLKGSTGETITIDSFAVHEVSETELTPSADPVPVDLDAYTGANPQLGIRIATSGDSVRLYGVQHQVAARALRPRIGPTGASTVTTGARSLKKTLSVAPTAIDVSMAFPVNAIGSAWAFALRNTPSYDYVACYLSNGTLRFRTDISASVQDVSGATYNDDDFVLIRIEWDGSSVLRLTENSETPLTLTWLAMPSFTEAVFGFSGDAAHLQEPILAFRDNLGNLLDAAPYGWNTRLLDTWT